jgi:hypothetical protein
MIRPSDIAAGVLLVAVLGACVWGAAVIATGLQPGWSLLYLAGRK